jgi:DNA-binding MarR family transcriptional regulator
VDGVSTAQGLDPLIHGKVRLGILSALAVNDSLSFSDLKGLLAATDGNLSAHARRLEDAGYIVCEKSFVGRVPKTEYRMTREGRGALNRYLSHMESLIQATRDGGHGGGRDGR